MNLSSVPSFYFSPFVALVDDDVLFIETLHDVLSQFFDVISFENASSFLDFVKEKDFYYIIQSTREMNEEDFTDHISIINLNYLHLAKCLENEFLKKSFLSVGFFDYMMPEMTGLECIQNMKDNYLYKILLTSVLEEKDIIHAFNDQNIQYYLSKTRDNICSEMHELILKNHFIVLDNLNKIFFGDSYTLNTYNKIYKDKDFVNFYNCFIDKNNIKFSCVYESGGSMIMYDHQNQKRYMNIYSKDEIESILFESPGFEYSISDINKIRCKNFDLIVNYKNDATGDQIGNFLTPKLTDNFFKLIIEDIPYYIVF